MSCTDCHRREAFFTRPYSGERLCQQCFISSVERRARKTISKYDMLRPDDRIAVAVSGGKDSLSLLHIIHRIEREFPKSEIIALTVDEGIPKYRDEAAYLATKACEKLGVEQTIISFSELYGLTLQEIATKIKGRRGELTPCSFCGVLRRKALNIAARRVGATKVATAHNLDDETHTMLLNIIHGDILRLGRTEPLTVEGDAAFIPRIKPLRETPEEETTLYAYLRGFEFQSAQCPHAPQALRTEIREFVGKLEANHPGTRFTIYQSFEKLSSFMKNATKINLVACKLCGEPSVSDICEACRMLGRLEEIREERSTSP
jgi:uncharacterized protein (TIGR00269 family)